MKKGIYQTAKADLIAASKALKYLRKMDNAAYRTALNDYADMLIKSFPLSLSDAQRNLYAKWLSSVCAKLH